MKYRIAMWANAGFLVASFWALYFFPTASIPITSAEPMWTLACLTSPVALAAFHLHFGIRFYWILLANAATYALLGLIVETLRQQISQGDNSKQSAT